jgi:hypothetical protein
MAIWTLHSTGALARDGKVVLKVQHPGLSNVDDSRKTAERIVALLNAAEQGGCIEQAALWLNIEMAEAATQERLQALLAEP